MASRVLNTDHTEEIPSNTVFREEPGVGSEVPAAKEPRPFLA